MEILNLKKQILDLFNNLDFGTNLRPIIFCGLSGSGKTTTKNELIRRDPDRYTFSVSCTTRKNRGNEKNAVDYHFISEKDFFLKINNNEFLEWQRVYQRIMYGTPATELWNAVANFKRLVLDVDVFGAYNIKKLLEDHCLVIYVDAGDINRNIIRLRQRGDNDEKEIAERVKKFQKEIDFAHSRRSDFIDLWHYNAGSTEYDLHNSADRLERYIQSYDQDYLNHRRFKNYSTL